MTASVGDVEGLVISPRKPKPPLVESKVLLHTELVPPYVLVLQ